MAYVPLVNLVPQFFDNLGDPLVGGTLSAYVAGTSTPTNMFSDNTGTVAGTSVTLDSRGEPTTIKLIWLNTAVNYKFILKDGSNTTIWTIDNIVPDSLADGSVSTAKLANGSVTTAKLADNAVTTVKIADSNVTTAKIADSNVTTAKIADNAVTNVKVADSAIDTAELADGAVETAKLNDGAVTTIKIADSNVTTAKIADANVTPAKLSQPITIGTAVTLTNQTSIDFTNIPSWVKKITFCFSLVSTNGTSPLIVQLGDSGGFETTGYSCVNTVTSGSSSSITFSTGFGVSISTAYTAATYLYSGQIRISLVDSSTNTWVASGMAAETSAPYTFYTTGSKSLSATLDRIRLTTSGGTNQFDDGKVNIIYEG